VAEYDTIYREINNGIWNVSADIWNCYSELYEMRMGLVADFSTFVNWFAPPMYGTVAWPASVAMTLANIHNDLVGIGAAMAPAPASSWWNDLMSGIGEAVGAGAGGVISLMGMLGAVKGFAGQVAGSVVDWLWPKSAAAMFKEMKENASHSPLPLAKIADRVEGLFLATTIAGFTATAISDLMGAQVFGSWDIPLNNLAGFIGKAAGWDPIFNAIRQPFFDTYIAQQWRQWLNSKLTPAIPGVGDLLELYRKRFITTDHELKELLAYHGLGDPWASDMAAAAWTEPRQRELLIMAEAEDHPWEWWAHKALALGYSDDDANYFVKGIQRYQQRTWINRAVGALVHQYVAGYITWEQLTEAVAAYGYGKAAAGWIAEAADRERWAEIVKTGITEALDEYDRDLLADEDLRDRLDALGLPAGEVDWRLTWARVKRLHKVYWRRPEEVEREKVSAANTLFDLWLYSSDELYATYLLAGYEAEVAAIMVRAAIARRASHLPTTAKQWVIKDLRDQVIAGQMTQGAYRLQLEVLAMPTELAEAESQFAGAVHYYDTHKRVEQYQLPWYQKAYILGLAEWPTLEAVMVAAGLSPQEIRARKPVLEEQRETALAGRAETTTAA
jgi:hypothetical protein